MVHKELMTFGIFYKYKHVCEAKEELGASPGTHPTLETNKQVSSQQRSDFCGHYQSYNKFVHVLTLSIFSSDEKYK